MAKWDRNRIMFFGSRFGTDIAEAASVETDSTTITKAVVVAATFGTKVGKLAGEYTFFYDGSKWTYKDVEAVMDDYGITVTGEPAENDAIVVNYTAAASGWEALGKDNDDLSKEMNPDTETSKNVLGESVFTHSGYEPNASVDPYYVDPSRKLGPWIKDIAMKELYGEDDCVGYYGEAEFTIKNSKKGIMKGTIRIRRAWFIPQSIGGDTSGANIPVEIGPFGPTTTKNITYNIETNEATVTDIQEGN